MHGIFKKTALLLDQEGQKHYLALSALSVVSSLLQTAGVASISLFFSILLGAQTPVWLNAYTNRLSFTTIGFLVLLTTLAGTASSGLATHYGLTLSWAQYPNIAERLLKKYLHNPYEWHAQKNSAELINTILVEAQNAILQVLQHAVLIIVRGAEFLFIALLLLIAKPLVALFSMASFGLAYLTLYLLNRKAILHFGKAVLLSNEDRQRTVTEALGGIKAVKVAQNSEYFEARFHEAALQYSWANGRIKVLSAMPRYFIEGLLFGGIVGFVILSQVRTWPIHESLPLLALYGAAGIRMLPAAQQLYFSFATMLSSLPLLEKILSDLSERSYSDSPLAPLQEIQEDPAVALRLERVSYRYPNSDSNSLNSVSLAGIATWARDMRHLAGAARWKIPQDFPQ